MLFINRYKHFYHADIRMKKFTAADVSIPFCAKDIESWAPNFISRTIRASKFKEKKNKNSFTQYLVYAMGS